MAQPFVGEIRMVGFNFAPVGYAFCNGQLMSIAQNDVLFNLIGTTYGGDGVNTFGLPDLRSRVPVHQGQGPGLSNYVMGQSGGTETVTVTQNQLPQHNHFAQAQPQSGNQQTPASGVWAASALNSYASGTPNANMNPNAIGAAGGSQPHTNMLPFLTLNFVIALFGIFPSQN